MAGSYVLDGLAVPGSLERLHALVEQVAAENPDVDPVDLSMFETAVVELAGNVVEHGRPVGKVLFHLCLDVRAESLRGLLSDSGEALPEVPAAEVPDVLAESGRGLALARGCLDELSYRRVDDRNTWTLLRVRHA